jgi:hypothetical protein
MEWGKITFVSCLPAWSEEEVSLRLRIRGVSPHQNKRREGECHQVGVEWRGAVAVRKAQRETHGSEGGS